MDWSWNIFTLHNFCSLLQCWARTLDSWLKFGISNRLKKNWNSTQFILWFQRLQNLCNLLVRQHSSSLSPSFSPCRSSGNLSEGCSRRESKLKRGKSTAKLLGLLSCFGCAPQYAGWTGEHKHREFPSWLQSLWAATGLLEENMLPLLLYWLRSRVKKVFMLCKFWAATSHFFFLCEWNFDGIGEKLLQIKAAPITLLNLSIILWSLSKNMT